MPGELHNIKNAVQSYRCVARCAIAYGYLISNPEWGVQLRVRSFAGDNGRGFSIKASRDLVEHEVLYPLMGLMPNDARAEHSRLSEILPHPSQFRNKANTEKGRVLMGPIRLVNHACHSYNAEVSDLLAGFHALTEYRSTSP